MFLNSQRWPIEGSALLFRTDGRIAWLLSKISAAQMEESGLNGCCCCSCSQCLLEGWSLSQQSVLCQSPLRREERRDTMKKKNAFLLSCLRTFNLQSLSLSLCLSLSLPLSLCLSVFIYFNPFLSLHCSCSFQLNRWGVLMLSRAYAMRLESPCCAARQYFMAVY